MNNTEINKRVAEIEGLAIVKASKTSVIVRNPESSGCDSNNYHYNPVKYWSQGGPLIEKYGLTLAPCNYENTRWGSCVGLGVPLKGDTPLVAAMLAIIEAHKEK